MSAEDGSSSSSPAELLLRASRCLRSFSSSKRALLLPCEGVEDESSSSGPRTAELLERFRNRLWKGCLDSSSGTLARERLRILLAKGYLESKSSSFSLDGALVSMYEGRL